MTTKADVDPWHHINTIRVLCADVVQKANSGHPGAPMGMAPVAHVLWKKFLKYNPVNALWPARDRFILSNGHACALLYAMLHLTGYPEWTMKDLLDFRQLGSKTPGHPEGHYNGIEVTTGPLGQGLANGVGLAIAEAHLAATYNKPGFNLVDHYTYVFCGDGCLQEGVTSEASSLAGHLGLGKLIVIYDDNKITIDGSTDLAFTEDVLKRYESYGWHTQNVPDGNSDLNAIEAAIAAAKKVTDKPSFIKLTTTIGFGSKKEGTEHVHGNPLGNEDIVQVKKRFGFDSAKTFDVSKETYDYYSHVEKGKADEQSWNDMFKKYSEAHPDLAKEFKRRVIDRRLPDGWKEKLPRYTPSDAPAATRKFGGKVLNVLADVIPEIFGGSADLNPSCFTYLEKSKDFQKNAYHNRNVRFGVREHAMCSIMNGISAYGGFIPFGSTFLNFIGYALGATVLAALSEIKCLFIMTHDSIGLGEDGPTHQPIEKYMIARETPNTLFFRPADGNETSGTYACAIQQDKTPSVIALSRQNVSNLKGTSIEGVAKGAYVIDECDGTPEIILIGTGSELELCVKAKTLLKDHKVRVVSFPCWELYEKQDIKYKESVFPDGVPVISVEAGSINGWARYAHASIGMTTFGASGKEKDIFKHFGFTPENVAEKAVLTINFYKGKNVPDLVHRPF
eukprot:TRINITY_DN1489_c0_g1_i2.p1 TRINITY_DN1489_c0_g1~~TRINITY_DN1489_c0_g1_i2.p1  ORF type:complete len:676 (-),score=164.88 TRINITY_DN1489_c0_g1_i2:30-2057(-)